LSNRRSIHFAVRFIILAAVVAAAAAYSTYSKRSMEAYAAGPSEPAQAQIANRGAKADRLAAPVPTSLTSAAPEPAFALASTPAATDLNGALAMTSMALPKEELVPSAAPAGPKRAVVAALPRDAAPPPHPKPKHPPSATSGTLDDNQIAGLRSRLRLTAEQTEYWPAVEAALRDVVRTQFRGRNLLHGKPVIDVNAPEVQKLIWAAMPLLMRLRDDQKGEVRKLARVIGLEQVASQI
jgi:hypothetical protein